MPKAITSRPVLTRLLPIGAEPSPEGTHFRVWAPDRGNVGVVLEGGPGASGTFPLRPEGDRGWFSGIVDAAGPGTRYRLRLDEEGPFPDPASRFQPEGPDGPSEVIDPAAFYWTDDDWAGIQLKGQVIYELHVGTFSTEGTWAGAAARLGHLVDLGITLVEVMPVAEFGGSFGWGYDGVDLFAPYHHYGRPEDMRAFVDRAHRLGLGVILDVVYNHFGPTGNYLPWFAAAYQSGHPTEWGPTYNYDGSGREGVRTFVLANAEHWIREYHLDGFRLDAVHSIMDDSARHIVAELTAAARAAAGERSVVVIAEDETLSATRLAAEEKNGWGIDGMWNDDAHHAAIVALTGRRDAYYSDYLGSASEMVAAARHGLLFQGQYRPYRGARSGEPTAGLAPRRLVTYLENHDQVPNSGRGERLAGTVGPAQLRAMTAFLLLGPATPLLFQGQEWGASAPFVFFADHGGELAVAVRKGRLEHLSRFRALADPEVRAAVPDPASREAAFRPCVLDWSERERPVHARWLVLHRDLIRLRRDDPAIARGEDIGVDAAVLTPAAWVVRWGAGGPREARLLIVNLGRDVDFAPPSEPLLAPPPGSGWTTLWSSEARRYGGRGTPEVEADDGWALPGPAAVLLGPRPR